MRNSTSIRWPNNSLRTRYSIESRSTNRKKKQELPKSERMKSLALTIRTLNLLSQWHWKVALATTKDPLPGLILIHLLGRMHRRKHRTMSCNPGSKTQTSFIMAILSHHLPWESLQLVWQQLLRIRTLVTIALIKSHHSTSWRRQSQTWHFQSTNKPTKERLCKSTTLWNCKKTKHLIKLTELRNSQVALSWEHSQARSRCWKSDRLGLTLWRKRLTCARLDRLMNVLSSASILLHPIRPHFLPWRCMKRRARCRLSLCWRKIHSSLNAFVASRSRF